MAPTESDPVVRATRHLAATVLAVHAVVLTGCSSSVRDAAITSLLVIGTDGRSLTVSLDSCHARPTVEIVEQSATRVVLAATVERESGDDCADVATVTSDSPLGDRRVVDRTTGEELVTDGVPISDDPAV
jgi:hypothetical protein